MKRKHFLRLLLVAPFVNFWNIGNKQPNFYRQYGKITRMYCETIQLKFVNEPFEFPNGTKKIPIFRTKNN